MRSAQITIKDIAERLGISPSTVSKALKNHPDINEKTRENVKKLADEWGYIPNENALRLRTSKSNIIGVIIPEISRHFFSIVMSGIEDVAYDAGYNVILCQSNELYSREEKDTRALLNSRIDGLIVSVAKHTKTFDHFQRVIDNHIPIVFFDRVCEELKADKVIIDDYRGAYEAVRHLISIGRKRIAHLSTSPSLNIGKERIRGYTDALKEHGIRVDEKLIIECDNYESALLITKSLIYDLNPPDAIFAVNDVTAIGAMQTILECGYKVPEDFAIVGYSNSIYSTMTTPQLTTVDQHGYKIGRYAASLLIDRIIRKTEYVPIEEKIETSLVIRGSTVKRKIF